MSGKNILVVTASMGSGHNKAANAVAEAIKRKYPVNKINVIDFMSTETAYFNSLVKDIYLKMLDHTPSVYEFFYKFTSDSTKGSTIQSVFAHAMKKDMRELIKKYEADMVICTHPFPCAAASYLKQTGEINIPLITVMTDFCVHQFWLYKNIDIYFTANDLLKKEMVNQGLLEERIFVTGIPVGYNFRVDYNRDDLLAKFKLEKDKPVALIMGGGLGLGGVKNALCQLERLKKDIQILVITGANVALWSEMNEYAQHSKHKIFVWGYSHNIQEFMSVATFLISKPGALTISEALTRELPMILHDPIPGPEVDNAKFVSDNGAAIWVRHQDTLDAVVREVLSDATILPKLRNNAKVLKKPYASDNIADIIANMLGLD
ncbi:MAG: glycosyltransferase [Megamonas funiformis]|jgi:processive 1,2-diacylglycerol beta-glucosyltransferase|uniref:MGDG synthase family glycosyltransferase n=1 Tax=Megamonas funiformis TaxID=437897 RepID=UPI000E519284|nr:glycosyltransferase [Megamonas funiformis]MDY3875366.1 glycosyltransferase [Megamonas funiformis]RHG12535.1 UDP-N-acetylglucosamine--LPS N-acetylglucosamine transferase [Megamonas funiformis]